MEYLREGAVARRIRFFGFRYQKGFRCQVSGLNVLDTGYCILDFDDLIFRIQDPVS